MTIDAVPGSPTANSYLTVADADAIVAAQGLGRAAEAWTAAIETDKEKALVRATSEIDAHIGVAGTAWSIGQPLLFPRYTDVTAGVPYIIPNVELATFHQAVHVLHNANQIDDADTRRARGLISFSDDDASGTNSTRPEYGMMSARALAYLGAIRATGVATLRSVPIASTYYRTVYE
jgi:Putative DnaT-like ssDNA binding protein